MKFENSGVSGEKHKDLESLYGQVNEEISGEKFDLNKRSKFVLKVNGQFVAKNDAKLISCGGARYIIQDKPFYFLSEILAQDARKFIEAKGMKARAEEIY